MKEYVEPKVKIRRYDCLDIITQSIGQFDPNNENDIVYDDIFGN